MERLIKQFTAKSQDGRTFELSVYEEVVAAASFADPNATIPGMKRIEDDDGRAVNYIDEETYLIVALDLTVKRTP